jgi:glycine cleavage system H protein
VVAVNEELQATPSLANQDPYSAWLVEIKPEDWAGVRGSLTPGSEVSSKYEAKMDSEGFAGCA